MNQNKETVVQDITENDVHGEIIISEDVISIIAGIAATEVEGVVSMDGGWSGSIISKVGIKDLKKGVNVEISDEHVSINLGLNIEYGYSIPELAKKVQDKVVSAVENMTGLNVLDVNINIGDLVTEE